MNMSRDGFSQIVEYDLFKKRPGLISDRAFLISREKGFFVICLLV